MGNRGERGTGDFVGEYFGIIVLCATMFPVFAVGILKSLGK